MNLSKSFDFYLFWNILARLLRHISTDSVRDFFVGVNTVRLGNLVAFRNRDLLRNLNGNFSADRNIDSPAFWGGSIAIPGVGRLVTVPGVLGVATLTVSSISFVTNLIKESKH